MKSFKDSLDEAAQPKWKVQIGKKHYTVTARNTAEANTKAKKLAAKEGNNGVGGRIERISEAMDPVNKDALKKKFKDRKDQDIDNDGDVDSSDEYLHKRRKAISKAIDEAKRMGAPKIKDDWLKKEREANRAHDAAMGRTATGRKKPVRQMTSTQRSLASMRKEEVELEEITSAKLKSYRAANEKDRERLSREIGFIKDNKPTDKQKKLIAKLQRRNTADMLAFKKDAPYLFKSMGKQAAKVDASDAYDDPKLHKSYMKYKKEEVEQIDESKALLKDYQAMKAQGKKDSSIIDVLMSMAKYKKMNRDQMAKAIGDAKRKGIFKEEVELDEAKSDYTIYHKTFSSAVQHAKAQVEKQGYTIDADEWDRKVAMGPKKPGTGKTNRYTIDLMKGGKETRRKLQMQVYYDEGRYELNMYVS